MFLKKYSYKVVAATLIISCIFAPLTISYYECIGGFGHCPYFKSYSEYKGEQIANEVHQNILNNSHNSGTTLIVVEHELYDAFWFLYPEDNVIILSSFLVNHSSTEDMNSFFSKNSVFLLDFRCESLKNAPKHLTRDLLCEDIIQFSDNIAYSSKGYAVYHLAPCSNCIS